MNDENPFIEAKRQDILYIMNEHVERARLALYLSLIIFNVALQKIPLRK